jgi:hypothetical protein
MGELYITRRVVLAGLAGAYLSAFTSLHAQFPGLLGAAPMIESYLVISLQYSSVQMANIAA